MRLVTLDFETYWADDYTLSSMTTEAYVRDPRFEAIMCGFKEGDSRTFWVPAPNIKPLLRQMRLDLCAVAAHHAHFDGLILSHHYGIRPKLWIDTLSMARPLVGTRAKGFSLSKLAEHYNIGRKGTEVMNAKNKHLADFTEEELTLYGEYCMNDVALTAELAGIMVPQLPRAEIELIDRTIRMFTEPKIELDVGLLEEALKELQADKIEALIRAGITLPEVRSDAKLAEAFMRLGVVPPTKISPKTGKTAFAFAKTDDGMQELLEHEDENVQALAAARLKNKTTIAESRTQRLIGMASRGKACVYYKYAGAENTYRHSGGDKTNFQNLGRKSVLRDAVVAPEGQVFVVGDSSNIEARVLDWLAGQEDAVEVYRQNDAGVGPDTYCVLASRIYQRTITKEDSVERQLGKITKLGLGYGMGVDKFNITLNAKMRKEFPQGVPREFVQTAHTTYRNGHPMVQQLWKRGDEALKYIAAGREAPIDIRGVLHTCAEGIRLPNGMVLRYPDLRRDPETREWSYWGGRARVNIYGAKVIENCVQALARIIVMEQSLVAARVDSWVMTTHDEAIQLAPEAHAPWALDNLLECMRVPPAWAPDLPLNSEGGYNRRYGKAKK